MAENKWIPVAERLPADGLASVLVCCGSPYRPYYDIARFAICLEDVDEFDFEGQKRSGFYSYDREYGYYEMSDVTHWMPLPEPPMEDEDD